VLWPFLGIHAFTTLARMLHEGNEDQGKYGKQGWSIACRCIAVATHQGGSTKIDSQISPEFVQAQAAIFNHLYRVINH
jgi:hypothetical protein